MRIRRLISVSGCVSVPVLIVGAGPVGLAAAVEFERWGVPFSLIDRAVGWEETTRAITVHARVQEWLAWIGEIDAFMEHGRVHRSMDYLFAESDKTARLDFTGLTNTRFPHVLMSNQNQTEAILRRRLAARGQLVRWGTRLISVVPDPDGGGVTATLALPDGRIEEVHAEYVIGCDGAHSTVRRELGLEFAGTEYAGRTRMADAVVRGLPLDDDRLHYLVAKTGMLMVTELPGGRSRLVFSEPGEATAAASVDVAAIHRDLQTVFDKWFPGRVTLEAPAWATEFKQYRRQSADYRRGRIFLAGDASNVRSIAGGMGLNCGMLDAINLAWKLAAVLTGKAHPSLLDSYERERVPADAQVMAVAAQLHAILMDHQTPVTQRIALVEDAGFQTSVTNLISGLGYTYRDVIHTPAGARVLAGLTAGDRAPDVGINARIGIHDMLDHPNYTLLTVHRRARSVWETQALVRQMRQHFGDRVRSVSVCPPDTQLAPTGTVFSDTNHVHDLYGSADSDVACLIRPDGYLAGRVCLADSGTLLADLSTVLI
ncbi:FAD-dependent monooxygenase [Nocardia wallacei]|uniref:FAD-dependent monooxygenase n=1 Tax=Nocardia wallacei TaxID=480035 RepID=UPI0024567F58|nr:FAD-dependent monooxygenase [Nocardia wallacei]